MHKTLLTNPSLQEKSATKSVMRANPSSSLPKTSWSAMLC
jgi:hypothetical protein